jgi:hypothetical protein
MSGFRDVVSFFYPDATARIDEIVVDAFVNETHTFSSEITDHPIESGGMIVDHVYQMPFVLFIDGIISNTPMNLIGLTAFDSAMRYFSGDSNDFAHAAFEKIEKLFAARKAVTIVTSLKTYQDMVLENLTIERGRGNQDSLRFSCSARQLRIIEQQKININIVKPDAAKPLQKKGLQEAKPISPEKAKIIEEEQSTLLLGAKATWSGIKNLFEGISK